MNPQHTPAGAAHRLLDLAARLSVGAEQLQELLSGLEPARRDAVVEAVRSQMDDLLGIWSELVLAGAAPERALSREYLASVPDERQAEEIRDHDAPVVHAVPDPPVASPYRRQRPQPEQDPVHGLTRDELTGVLNRTTGFSALSREIERCRQDGSRFILGCLNVDGLSQVNEARGPRAGDELLRKIAAALRATLRSYDVILRLGGDEFLFSLPSADMATAEQRLHEFRVLLGEEAPGASVSVGFAELRRGDTLDDLVARADDTLIQSRRTQRHTR
ncbi:MAG: GGDEF domain-containing protein [Acidimicrobiales bacterium]